MADPATSQGGPFDLRVRPEAPWALARLPAGRHGLPREFVEANQRNRLMAAALEVFAGRGYAAGSISDVVKSAGVSRQAFYAYFPDKEAAFLATYDVAVAWLTEQAFEATRDADGWGREAIAAIGSLTRVLAGDPRLARLCAVEVFQAGPTAARRHAALTERLASALRCGRSVGTHGAGLPPLLEPVLVGGAISVLVERADNGDGERLDRLGPQLSEALLAPYFGLAVIRELISTSS